MSIFANGINNNRTYTIYRKELQRYNTAAPSDMRSIIKISTLQVAYFFG